MTKTTSTPPASAILLIHCPDQKGVVSAITEFIFKNNGNITYLDQHVDQSSNTFFMRLEWNLEAFSVPKHKIGEDFGTIIGGRFKMTWKLHFSDETPRMAIFCSKLPHCLYDILSRWKSGELNIDIPLIMSNHFDLEPVAKQFGIDFNHFKISPENKEEQEEKQLKLLGEHQIDFIVLARYMQILSKGFVEANKNRVINIHHSFLPAFPGARPYHSAYVHNLLHRFHQIS
ncbi:MAG: formyltetrahydrofolate deformylase [bacterium]|nr:formyltetrahydrofolate deformylase [bacterium]